MPRLRATGRYVNDPRNLAFDRGDEFDADDELAEFLHRDAPGAFKEMKEPPANKAVLNAPQSKQANDDLTVISGISRGKAMHLHQLGIASYADLAAADVETLATIQGVGDVTASEWIEAAQELV